MSKKMVLLFMILSFLLLSGLSVNADSSSLFRYGETVQPINNNNVRMVEEKVDIEVYGGWSVVRCEFVFRNESDKDEDVLMGFPASMIGVEADLGIDETTRLRDFKTYDEGAEKEVKLEKSEKESAKEDRIAEWYTWDVHFEAGEERKIVNTYKTQNYNAPWGRHSGYILKTGAPWKGTIGKAVITFVLMDIAPSRIYEENTSPKGYRVEKNKIIWEMKDFEPTEDISLVLEGYWSIYSMLYGQNEEYINNTSKKIEQARMLFMDDMEEALNQINQLLEEGVYAEDLYFCILNYYHKQGNTDEFIKVLKDEIKNLNNSYILEWAEILYPDRLKAEGISYPKNHKPVISNQKIRKLDEKQFELSAHLHDEAGDMIFLSSTSYTDSATMSSMLEYDSSIIVFGYMDYDYKAKGKLPEPYEDLIWRLEVSDYEGNADTGMTLDADRIGESCYFYDGNVFLPWVLKKDNLFSLCYYDKSFDSMEADFRKELNDRLGRLIAKLGIKAPAGGYLINLYEKSHIDKLKKDAPQNITLYLKKPEYRAKLHNDAAAGKSEEQAMQEWDWGEIIVEMDIDNDIMIESVLQKIIAYQFGTKWENVKTEVVRAFIAAVNGEHGKGSYYEAFSKMTKEELQKSAQDIGITGNTEHYAKGREEWIIGIIILLIIGAVIYTFCKRLAKVKTQ